jgi:hypothetical protein
VTGGDPAPAPQEPRARGLAAAPVALNPSGVRTSVGGVRVDPATRPSPVPVGSDVWLRMPGTGRVEVDAEDLW